MIRATTVPSRTELVVRIPCDESWMGGLNYIESLLATLSTLPADERPSVHLRLTLALRPETLARLRAFPVVSDARRDRDLLGRLFRRTPLPTMLGSPVAHLLRQRRSGADRVVFPVMEAAPDLRHPLYWITDFQHLHLPQFFSAEECLRRHRLFAGIAAADGVLIVSSRAALEDFRRLFPAARVKVRVWSFCSNIADDAAADAEAVRQRYGLPEKYLYLPNQFWAHKNHLTVFRALTLLRRQEIRPVVVCTGSQSDFRHPGHFAELESYLRESGLTDQVKFLGIVPRADQRAILGCCAAIVQPSLFEGWSTVVEDAKAVGRPIFLSDIPVHREQVMGEDCLFPPLSAEALAQSIARRWGSLAPGPDHESERRAREATEQRRVGMARQFLGIIEEARLSAASTALGRATG
jgi:glycosyltransferase involved in cell wall biosynthesis